MYPALAHNGLSFLICKMGKLINLQHREEDRSSKAVVGSWGSDRDSKGGNNAEHIHEQVAPVGR
jgi:hypothetical protein